MDDHRDATAPMSRLPEGGRDAAGRWPKEGSRTAAGWSSNVGCRRTAERSPKRGRPSDMRMEGTGIESGGRSKPRGPPTGAPRIHRGRHVACLGSRGMSIRHATTSWMPIIRFAVCICLHACQRSLESASSGRVEDADGVLRSRNGPMSSGRGATARRRRRSTSGGPTPRRPPPWRTRRG